MNRSAQGAIELDVFITWMGDDGIARTVVKPDAEIYIQHAKQNTTAVQSFYNGKKFPLLVDIRNIRSISREARDHFTLQGRETTVNSFALVLSSSLSRMIGNFFMSFHRPAVPVRLFNDENEALRWLNGFVEQPGN